MYLSMKLENEKPIATIKQREASTAICREKCSSKICCNHKLLLYIAPMRCNPSV